MTQNVISDVILHVVDACRGLGQTLRLCAFRRILPISRGFLQHFDDRMTCAAGFDNYCFHCLYFHLLSRLNSAEIGF